MFAVVQATHIGTAALPSTAECVCFVSAVRSRDGDLSVLLIVLFFLRLLECACCLGMVLNPAAQGGQLHCIADHSSIAQSTLSLSRSMSDCMKGNAVV